MFKAMNSTRPFLKQLQPMVVGLLAVFLSLTAPAEAQTYFGNQSLITTTSSFPLDSDTARADIRFTAQQSSPITEVQLFFSNIQGTPEYTVSLQSDSGGLPSGTPLAGTTSFTPTLSANGTWTDIPLSSPVNVSAGTVYHLVVVWDSGFPAISPTNRAVLVISTTPDNYFYPVNGAPDAQLAVATDSGNGTWNPLAQEPIFLLNYSGTWSGNSYINTAPLLATLVNMATVTAGEYFSVGSPLTISSVGAYASEASPADNLYWTLINTAGPATLGTGTLATPAQLVSGSAWVDAPIAPLVLPTGNYLLEFTSPSSAAGTGYYPMALMTSGLLMGGFPWDQVTYGGDNSHGVFSTKVGLFTVFLGGDFDLDFRFQLAVPPTPTPVPQASNTLFVSLNLFQPSQGPVSIFLSTNQYPGDLRLKIYNSAGEYIQTLEDRHITSAYQNSYSWNGTNTKGDKVADGVYFFLLTDPAGIKRANLLVVK